MAEKHSDSDEIIDTVFSVCDKTSDKTQQPERETDPSSARLSVPCYTNNLSSVSHDVLAPMGFYSESQGIVLPKERQLRSYPTEETCKEYDFDINSLKDLVTHATKTTKIRPVLISFSGLPESGKTMAVRHILDNYVDNSPLNSITRKSERIEVAGISHYELVAAGLNPLKDLCITEVTQESSLAAGILSAFKNDFTDNGQIPLFNLQTLELTHKFDNHLLDDHLLRIYKYLCGQGSIPKGPNLTNEEKKYGEKLQKVLPEGIALINIWDLSINETVRHFLAALHGHLYNNHTWLFLDLDRDLNKLDKPPEIKPIEGRNDSAVFMKWRPRLHYLLRSCRMSESKIKKKQKKRMCTIFAKHDGTSNGELQEKIDKLEDKIRPVAKQAGFSSLLEERIQTINLSPQTGNADNYSRRVYQKFQHVIYETPYENIPLVWVFLRSMLYCYEKKFIVKNELEEMAVKCGMKQSFDDFCKFYTSFGSIFDLNLINPDYPYIITKPIEFLKLLDKCLYPNDGLRQQYPTIQHGIIPNKACRKVFGGDWPVFTDALLSLNLAIEVPGNFITIPPEIPSDRNETYYYVSLSRSHTAPLVEEVDLNSIHVITSINTPHIFKQVALTKRLLNTLPQPKLVPCPSMNQTIIKENSTNTTLTIVSHSPATRLSLDKPNVEMFSHIVKTYQDIAANCRGSAKYKFVALCSGAKIPDVQSIPSSRYHILPEDKLDEKCPHCREAGKGKSEVIKAWNGALKKNNFQSKLEEIDLYEFADIATKLGSDDLVNVDVAKLLEVSNEKDTNHFEQPFAEGQSKIKQIDCMLKYWEAKSNTLEPRRVLARKVSELGEMICSNTNDKEDQVKIKEKFETMAKEIDLYYKPNIANTLELL